MVEYCLAQRSQAVSWTSRLTGRRYQRTFELSLMILLKNVRLRSSCRSASVRILCVRRTSSDGMLPKMTWKRKVVTYCQLLADVSEWLTWPSFDLVQDCLARHLAHVRQQNSRHVLDLRLCIARNGEDLHDTQQKYHTTIFIDGWSSDKIDLNDSCILYRIF